jgi:hypothetical protein
MGYLNGPCYIKKMRDQASKGGYPMLETQYGSLCEILVEIYE